MNHDDIVSLFELGMKLFTDVNHATHNHHSHQVLNNDNLSVAGDLVKVGQKLYKIGSDAQRASVPVFASTWRTDDGGAMGFAYNKNSGVVVLSFPHTNGDGGYNFYKGAGQVFSNSIGIMVSGYNRQGTFIVIQGTSDDGYRINLANWYQNYGIEYDGATRVSEWVYG